MVVLHLLQRVLRSSKAKGVAVHSNYGFRSNGFIFFDDVTEEIFPGVCKAIEIIESKYSYKIELIKFSQKRGYAIATKLLK